MNQKTKRQRIYAVLTITSSAGDNQARLQAMLEAHEIASLLIAPAEGHILDAATVQPLVSEAQKHGVAVLIAADPVLARDTGADGVHVPWSKDIAAAYTRAREIAGPNAIVGADAGRSRHDAMTLGEKGADYVAFGIPPHVEDRATAHERQMELLEWWSDIFEIPCVAFDVASADDAAAAVSAGADFVTWSPEAGLGASHIGQTLATLLNAVNTSKRETV